MGSGTWNSRGLNDYVTKTKGMCLDSFKTASYDAQEMYTARHLSPKLDPKNIMRECRDSAEHPNTFPVILALDVTGSMGNAAVKVAQKLDDIMTALYADENIKDIEFCVMGIGDMYYDQAPVQMSQFESDIRIAEQLDEIYFEGHGGGNGFESYTAAWYMGSRHCDLDCWKRGKKGLIITMGDELPNPYLPVGSRFDNDKFKKTIGDSPEADIETKNLLEEACEKFIVYHLSVDDPGCSYKWNNRNLNVDNAWKDLLGENYMVSKLDELANTITSIIKDNYLNQNGFVTTNTPVGEEVVW